MAETVPEHQDGGLFGLFGKRRQSRAITLNQTQTQDAHLYPTNPPHAAVVNQPHAQGYGHGHASIITLLMVVSHLHSRLMAPFPSFPSRSCISFFNAKFSRYDIFLSFRGTDLRRGFVDHLYHALTNAGFRAFLDTYSLNRGDDISSTLHHAIEESRILMPIFSTNYAQSPWCLREASHIARQLVLQRQGNGSSIAIPLFYDVTPAQVRRPDQSGSPFAEAFKEHEMSGRYSPQEIHQGKAALFQLCRLSGWSLPEDFNGYEAALVKRVVEDVAKHCMTGRRSWPSI